MGEMNWNWGVFILGYGVGAMIIVIMRFIEMIKKDRVMKKLREELEKRP